MFPVVRPGDVLTIEPRPVFKVEIGDICVCRSGSHLFAHRAVAKGEDGGQAYIVTRPDRNRGLNDMPTFDENLLGVVSGIKRKGLQISQQAMLQPARYCFWSNVYIALFDIMSWSGDISRYCAVRLSNSYVYKTLSRVFWRLMRPRYEFSVRVPLSAELGDTICRQFHPDFFDPEILLNGKRLMRWILTVKLNGEHKPSAWIVVSREISGSWFVEESGARARYSGLGLKEKLLARASQYCPLSCK